MNRADTLDMCLFDYQAALHGWSEAHRSPEDTGADDFTPDELDAAFSRMAQRGIARLH